MNVRKNFFFEKKKQKTFVHLDHARFNIPVMPAQAGIHVLPCTLPC
jgi:hypothetical protein